MNARARASILRTLPHILPPRSRRAGMLTRRALVGKTAGSANRLRAILTDFHAHRGKLIARYDVLVCTADVAAARRDLLARKITALDRAIAAIESYKK